MKSKCKINIPNLLSIIRIILVPFIVLCFLKDKLLLSLVLLALSALSDVADGKIARKYNQITDLGKILDPIADKLSLLTLLGLFVADGQISSWILGVVLLKEAALIVGSVVAFRRGIIVYALPIGKITTVAFILSMVCRFVNLRDTADVLLGVSVALSLIALIWYTVVMLKKLRNQESK